MKQESLWFAAYVRVKSNLGSETPGPDFETMGALTKKRILELRLAVYNNNFNWKGVRQTHIAKPGKPGKTLPLGIPATHDRFVQEVNQSILEPVFELPFKHSSMGFRPNRSCHIALKKIITHMKNSIMFIEGDINNYFPGINHAILIRRIQKRIQHPKIFTLLKTGLKANVFEKDKTPFSPQIGTH